MSKSGAQLLVETGKEEVFVSIAGQSLHHDLQLDLTGWTGWNAVAEALAAAGADVQSLRIQRTGQGAFGRCRFTGPNADEARDLAAALIEAGLVRGARVEHLLLKANETAL